MSSPPAQTWPPMEDFLATVLPRPADTGAFRSSYPQIFLFPPKFCCAQKTCFKHMIKIFPLKLYLAPQTLKPGYGPGSAKIVSAIRIFCLEGHLASRCSMTSKTFFYKSPLGGGL